MSKEWIRRDRGRNRAVLRPLIFGIAASVRQSPHGYVNLRANVTKFNVQFRRDAIQCCSLKES